MSIGTLLTEISGKSAMSLKKTVADENCSASTYYIDKSDQIIRLLVSRNNITN
jgi:hypothetical protein